MRALPIDPLLPEISRVLCDHGAVVLEAPPGAGKTTRVPQSLLSLPDAGEILVLEPRRLAARLAARFVAEERSERAGQTVGYSVRFEDVSSPRTRIRYVTEGVLLRRLLDDPELAGIGVVVLDEFHERHLSSDVALVLLERLRRRRAPELKLVVMSATLDGGPIARYLGCPRLTSEGRRFELTIEHLDRPDDRPLEKQIASAVRRLIREGPPGDVLVFLPGAAEIRRSRDALEPLAAETGIIVLPLHGDLPLAEQARAVEPADRMKVVLATNVAESSVTIDGIVAVVDSGLARNAAHSAFTGLPRLETAKISRAAAAQRAGRAGRTRNGRVLRLYTKGDLESRREFDAPELLRLDLSEAWLILHGAGIAAPGSLDFLDAPPAAAVAAAETLLSMLGALDAEGRLSPTGQELLRFPLHPRLARIVIDGERAGVAARTCLIAALLGERDIRIPERVQLGRASSASRLAATASGPSDVLELVDRFEEARDAEFGSAEPRQPMQASRTKFRPDRLRQQGLDPRTVHAVDRARQKLEAIARDAALPPLDREAAERALMKAVLAGFADRVAKRRRPGARELVLSNGQTAELGESSVVTHAPLMVAVDVEERSGQRGAIVRLASAIHPEWLLDEHAELLRTTDELVFDSERARVERVSRISCGSVVLEESRSPAAPSPDASRLLVRAALARGITKGPALDALAARIALVREHLPRLELPELGSATAASALEAACEGRTSLAEVEASDLSASLMATLAPAQRAALAEHAPERIKLPSGRSLDVTYATDKPPCIESRLQDFFGMKQGPRICSGGVAVVLHLLAPNGRAVQVTSDLSGFWQRHYPALRRELMRRYPKHAWPDDPLTAKPPAPRAVRGAARR